MKVLVGVCPKHGILFKKSKFGTKFCPHCMREKQRTWRNRPYTMK